MTRTVVRTMVVALVLVAGALVSGGAAAAPVAAETPRTADDLWLDAAYRTLLHRLPSSAQRAHRLGQLAAGRPRLAMAIELARSAERRALVIDRTYRDILGRGPDAAGRAYWVERTANGYARFVAQLYASAEYARLTGRTLPGYVRGLYHDMLGIEGQEVRVNRWVEGMLAGTSRADVVLIWRVSLDVSELRANRIAIDILGRPLSVTDRAYWGIPLRKGDDSVVEARLVASPEFARRAEAQTTTRTITPRGDGVVGRPSVSLTGRYIVFASSSTTFSPVPTAAGPDVFVADLTSGRLWPLTTDGGVVGDPDLSLESTTVVFASSHALVAGDDEGHVDIYRTGIRGGPVERLTAGDGDSTAPTVSSNGTAVAYQSLATDLVAGDDNGVSDVFVRRGVAPNPDVDRYGGDGPSTAPQMADGQCCLVFTSSATDLVADDDNGRPDAFWASVVGQGTPTILRVSGDGGSSLAASVTDDGSPIGVVEEHGPDPATAAVVTVVQGHVGTRTAFGGFVTGVLVGSRSPRLLLETEQATEVGHETAHLATVLTGPNGTALATVGAPAGLSGDGRRVASVEPGPAVAVLDLP